MTHRGSFVQGILVGSLAMLALDAVRWILTPLSHPNATSVHQLFVALQGIVCFMAAIAAARWTPAPVEAAQADVDEMPADRIQGTATVVEDYNVQSETPIKLQVTSELTVAQSATRPAVVREDKLLPVERGQVVIIRERRRDWLLVGTGTGVRGWIPTSHVDRVPEFST